MKSAVESVLKDAGLKSDQIGTVCCNTWRSTEIDAVQEMMGDGFYRLVDMSSQLGFAPSSSPLFNIAAALNSGFFVGESRKNYILTIFSSFYGMNCIVIIEKNLEMKE